MLTDGIIHWNSIMCEISVSWTHVGLWNIWFCKLFAITSFHKSLLEQIAQDIGRAIYKKFIMRFQRTAPSVSNHYNYFPNLRIQFLQLSLSTHRLFYSSIYVFKIFNFEIRDSFAGHLVLLKWHSYEWHLPFRTT